MTDRDNMPKHVAIIMDGNGRWAEARGLPRSAGHLAGYENAKKLIPYIFKKGIGAVTVYAFSTENWLRGLKEVNSLFDIFRKAVEELPDFAGENIRIRFIGNRIDLASRGFGDLVASMERVEKETAQNTRGTFIVAINYGGREEILRAIKEIVRLNVHPAYINESAVSHQLYTAGLPDPDLIIRTAGERRLSGFLLWQSAYSELYFSQKSWPAFGKKDFLRALEWYKTRERKFGGYGDTAAQ
ncbi:MAG: polyprenyl diphosphate synthase [Candidatus Spechtbacterales bacterium]